MKLIPTKTVNYTTSLSQEQIVEIIKLNTEKMGKIHFSIFKKFEYAYQGEVSGNRFRMLKNIKGRNSFRARIYGEIYEKTHGSEIKVFMDTYPIIKIFMFVWLGGVGLGCLLTLVLIIDF